MSTSTIDHSPVSHEQQPVATATLRAVGERAVVHSGHEIDTTELRERFNRIGVSVRKQIPMHYNFLTLAKVPAKRAEMLWRQHQYVEAPLMELYEDYSETDQPFGNFVNAIAGVNPSTEPTKPQKQSIAVIVSSIRHGLAVRQLQALLDQHGAPYALPDADGIKDGVDLYIKGRPYRFKLSGGATSLISAKVEGTYQKALPTPYPGKLPDQYQLPTYSSKVQLALLNSLGIPTKKDAVLSTPTPASPQTDTPKQNNPQQTRANTAKPKSARQIAHEQRVAEIQAKKAARRLASIQHQIEPRAKKTTKQVRTEVAEMSRVASERHNTRSFQKAKDLAGIIYRDETVISSQVNTPILPYNSTPDTMSLRGEKYALDIINQVALEDVAIVGKRDLKRLQQQILGTIHSEDLPHIRVLKQLASNILLGGTLDARTLINTLDDRMSVSELRDFIMTIKNWVNPEVRDEYANNETQWISGFGVELSVEKIARLAGYTVITATELAKRIGVNVDSLGVDLLIDGVPFDIKSSRTSAVIHAQKYINNKNRFHAIKFVPPFTAEDFDDHFVIPDDRVATVLEKTDFLQMIDEAVEQYLRMEQPDELFERDEADAKAAELRAYERSKHQAAYDELDKLALNATRHWRRKVKKAATERWG